MKFPIRSQLNLLCVLVALLLSACSGGGSDGSGARKNNGLSDIVAYDSEGEYAAVLADCVRAESEEALCLLSALPYLGQETSEPDIADIMSRVVVSHEWMGERFEQVLNTLPSEMLDLFASVTAIVIDSDIRPSHYISGTGAIYLDSGYLWLTPEELDTVNTRQDYRSDFVDPLNFRVLSRYVKNGRYAYDYWRWDEDGYRTIGEIRLALARVLLHELAHAVDVMQPEDLVSLDTNQTAYDAVIHASNIWVSDRLRDSSPLQSSVMQGLAEVMYHGRSPTEQETQISAYEAGLEFGADSASDDYAYTSQYEDVAMLFEASMMRYFFGAEQEIGFFSPPSNPDYCNYYTISWGAINRIGHNNVKDRAQFIVNEILPNISTSNFFAALPSSRSTRGNWCVDAPLTAQFEKSQQGASLRVRQDDYKREID